MPRCRMSKAEEAFGCRAEQHWEQLGTLGEFLGALGALGEVLAADDVPSGYALLILLVN